MSGTELIQRIRQVGNDQELHSMLELYVTSDRTSYNREEHLTISVIAVEMFKESSFAIPIAEVLSRFGEEIISPLTKFVEQSGHSEAKLLASLILLQRGIPVGVTLLLQEIASQGEYSLASARALTTAGVRAHIPLLIECVRRRPIGPNDSFPTPEQDELLTIIRLLVEMDVSIPSDIYGRLTATDAPVFLRNVATQLQHSITLD